MISAKKQRKTIEWERLKISPRKLEFISTHFMQRNISCKGTFHAKMVSIKDRNAMDITKAEAIKKRWQEYTALTCSYFLFGTSLLFHVQF